MEDWVEEEGPIQWDDFMAMRRREERDARAWFHSTRTSAAARLGLDAFDGASDAHASGQDAPQHPYQHLAGCPGCDARRRRR